MNQEYPSTPARKAAITGLAGVGFIALVALGVWLAVYSARYVPTAVNGLGAAAVYLGSIFTPATPPGIAVVPTASTTISFDTSSTTPLVGTGAAAISTSSAIASASHSAAAPTYYHTVTTDYPTPGSTRIEKSPASYSGLDDLAVTIVAVGYLTADSPDSFVVSPSVPTGRHAAVEFIIKNVGTNIAPAGWSFSASIPTQTSYTYQSSAQQALNPGDNIQYTLGFDRARTGTGQPISVSVNADHTIGEATWANDTASATITIQ